MYSNLFSAQSVQDLMSVLPSLPFAIWETFYVTVVSTALSLVLGLPLGVLLVAGEKNGVLPLPRWLMQVINVIINLLRSIPFLILMIMVFPLSRLLIGTAVGTTATIVPLVAAAFPFVARLVESSLREVDGNIIEAAQSMGATPMQIICKVMIPESVPSLIQNVTIALTTILGYSAMSGIIGGGGLGKIAIDYGYYRYKYLVMLVAVVILILLVQLFQSVGTWLSKRCDKRLKPYSRLLFPSAFAEGNIFSAAPFFTLTFLPKSCMIFEVVKAYNFTEGGHTVKNQTYRMTMLFDFYGDILTPRQRELFDLYYNEDLSLAEIAENCGISRQGVRDVIVRAENAMTELEDKTGLVRRFLQMQQHVDRIITAAGDIKTINYRQYENPRLEELAETILDAAAALKE